MQSDEFKHLSALVVDGHQHSSMLLRINLKALGMRRIDVVESTDVALRILRSETYEVVFCNDDCAGANPVAFFKAMRRDPESRNPAVPILFVTGGVRRRQVELMRDCGANCVLVRPLSAEAVARKLRSVVFAPKRFVSTDEFIGPDRRADDEKKPFTGSNQRRKDLAKAAAAIAPRAKPGPGGTSPG